MVDLSAENVIDYLRQTGRLGADVRATAAALAWGVSNLVVRVEPIGRPALVIKQSRPQLRTKVEWFSRCERIFREADVLRVLGAILPAGTVPEILFEDRPNFVLAMSAIRADHVVWKQTLLEGDLDLDIAAQLGVFLGLAHRESAGQPQLLPDSGDWSLFDELRIDPFYRWIARQHPLIAPAIADLIDEMSRQRVCLVLADFSPKNVLVHDDGVALVDFETAHYGDPAFDLGFFLSHILLKSLRWPEAACSWRQLIAACWACYRQTVDAGTPQAVNSGSSSPRAVRHLAGCLLARIDGKSTVDYLPEAWQAEFVRRITLNWLQHPPLTIDHALDEYFAGMTASARKTIGA